MLFKVASDNIVVFNLAPKKIRQKVDINRIGVSLNMQITHVRNMRKKTYLEQSVIQLFYFASLP